MNKEKINYYSKQCLTAKEIRENEEKVKGAKDIRSLCKSEKMKEKENVYSRI